MPSSHGVKKGLPFCIPKLNVAGLGLSELIPDEKKEEKKSSKAVQ